MHDRVPAGDLHDLDVPDFASSYDRIDYLDDVDRLIVHTAQQCGWYDHRIDAFVGDSHRAGVVLDTDAAEWTDDPAYLGEPVPVGAVHGDVPPTVDRPLPPDAGTMRSERP